MSGKLTVEARLDQLGTLKEGVGCPSLDQILREQCVLDWIWYAVVVARFFGNEKVQLHPTAFKVEKHALDGRPRNS